MATVSDDFNRADSTSLGANWSVGGSTTGATPGNATNGVNGRFKYVPDLKGFIYVPSWGSAYFLRTVA